MKTAKSNTYGDIIRMPHHVSPVHPRMALAERAAQFAPFAALTGYGEVIRETARLTRERIELDENCKSILDGKLQMVKEQLRNAQKGEGPVVAVTYFVPDKKKAGGAYVKISGMINKIDEYRHMIMLHDGTRIPTEDIVELEGELFGGLSDGAETIIIDNQDSY